MFICFHNFFVLFLFYLINFTLLIKIVELMIFSLIFFRYFWCQCLLTFRKKHHPILILTSTLNILMIMFWYSYDHMNCIHNDEYNFIYFAWCGLINIWDISDQSFQSFLSLFFFIFFDDLFSCFDIFMWYKTFYVSRFQKDFLPFEKCVKIF